MEPNAAPELAIGADDYFAIIPEWVLFADISHQAVRLYCVLRRKADNQTNESFYSRRSLAAFMHLKDPRVVDRALDDLERIGAVVISRNRINDKGDHAPNLYRVVSARGGSAQKGTGVVPEKVQGVVPKKADYLIANNLIANISELSTPANAGDVVAAYVDAYRNHHGEEPPARAKGRLAREARELITEGRDVSLIMTAAEKCAAEGHANIVSAYTWVQAQPSRQSSRTAEKQESNAAGYLRLAQSFDNPLEIEQ